MTPSAMARRMSSIHRPAYGPLSRRVYHGLVNRWTPLVIAWAAALAGFALLSILAVFNDKFPGGVWLAHRTQELDIPGFAHTVDRAADTADLPAAVSVCGGAVGLLLVAVRLAG